MKRFLAVPLFVVSFHLLACGPAAPGRFVGTWNGNGTFTMTANTDVGAETSTHPLASDDVDIMEGVSSDIVIQWSGCQIPSSVKDQIATFQAGFSCTQSDGQVSEQFTFTAGTATVVQDIITLASSGNFTFTDQGATVTGTFNLQEQLTKVGNK